MVRAVVFDLDYTLAVPDRDRATILAEAAAAVGAPDISREEYLDAHRETHAHQTRAPIFDRLLEGEADADADADELAREYSERVTESLVPVEGAEALVTELRRRYRVGLLTDGPVRAQQDKLRALDWTDLFDSTVITGALRTGKPDRLAFQAVLDTLDVRADEAAYVGDDPDLDVHGAKDAGLFAVQVLYPGGPEPDDCADAYVDRARLREDLPDALAGL